MHANCDGYLSTSLCVIDTDNLGHIVDALPQLMCMFVIYTPKYKLSKFLVCDHTSINQPYATKVKFSINKSSSYFLIIAHTNTKHKIL